MDIEQAREKIKKCLNLANDPNAQEALVALAMARKLMAQFKLSAHDLDEDEKEIVELDTGITCSKQKEFWLSRIAGLIARRHCCVLMFHSHNRERTKQLVFIGHQADAEIAKQAFTYAAQFVRMRCTAIEKDLRADSYSTGHIRQRQMDYGIGFMKGLKEAYDRQDNETMELGDCVSSSTAVVLVVPADVTQHADQTSTGTWGKGISIDFSSSAYRRGYHDGVTHLQKKISDKQEAV
ncbi:MAG: DUF2786 domain-containing protein [Candidatus Methanomethylophilaceae archaeon]|jgi:hypothetical protein